MATNRYIALLRAVNVGGRFVKMDQLKEIFTAAGLSDVGTYIQSGNVLFATPLRDEAALISKIESALLDALGYEVKVLLTTAARIGQILADNPYTLDDARNEYISFLSAIPDPDKAAALMALATGDEGLTVVNDIVYFICPAKTYGRSQFSNSFVERKLKVAATTRNVTTLVKMMEL